MKRQSTPRSKVMSDSYSMPILSGLYTKPPYHYRQIKQILVNFTTDSEVLRQLTPEPVIPNPGNDMFLLVSEMFGAGFGKYLEAHLFSTARFKRKPVNFSHYLILDNDVATCGGREIWGWPKKIGRLTFEMCDDVVKATVERGSINLVTATMRLEEFGSSKDVEGTPDWICHKIIPSVSNKMPDEVNQLTLTTLSNISVKEVHKGPATLEFGSSPSDRLSNIPILEIKGGFFYESQFTLGDGKVVHDYLK